MDFSLLGDSICVCCEIIPTWLVLLIYSACSVSILPSESSFWCKPTDGCFSQTCIRLHHDDFFLVSFWYPIISCCLSHSYPFLKISWISFLFNKLYTDDVDDFSGTSSSSDATIAESAYAPSKSDFTSASRSRQMFKGMPIVYLEGTLDLLIPKLRDAI